MPRPTNRSLAQILKDEHSEGPVAVAPVEQVEQVHEIDSAKISSYFEPTSVRRRRAFEGVEPVIEQAQKPPVPAPSFTVGDLSGLSDEELAIARDALFEAEADRAIRAEAESDAALHGWESYGVSYTYEPEAEDELVDTDLFGYLNGAA